MYFRIPNLHFRNFNSFQIQAPFSVHPKTGKICVPFTAEDVGSFDLEKVPTVISVRVNPNELKPYVKLLDDLTENCLKETQEKLAENKENSAPKSVKQNSNTAIKMES